MNVRLIDKDSSSQNDPDIGHLRAQIKKVMIPLLIRIFELKLAAQQGKNPPSRLQKKQHESVEEIHSQLKTLEEELKLLQLWCHSCQKQIDRALGELVPAPPPTPSRYTQTTPQSNSKQPSSTNWLTKFLKK